MKIKCFWEKSDVISGIHVCKENKTESFMVVSRGFSNGEPEFNLVDISTGELVMNTFMNRKGMSEYLTQNDFGPKYKAKLDLGVNP